MHRILIFLLALSSAFASERPNIVFLMTDDQRWDNFGCYGKPEFKTQHIDKLAAEGVIFDNSYYAVAICKPSRATVMTGRYLASHNCGFTYPHNDVIPADAFADTYHARLKAAGYRSGFVGKFGFTVEATHETLKKHFDYFDASGQPNNFAGRKWAKEMTGFREIYRKDRDPKERTIIKGDSMLNFLETQPEGQPFILSVSFDAVKNDNDDDMYRPDTEIFAQTQMTVPENWVEGMNHELPKVIKDNARGYRLHGERSSTPEQYQRNTRRFATQGVTVDNQVGRLIEKLTEMGVLENTIIIYTSDNGRYHGSHGLYDKALLHEDSVKAPLVIWDGRVAANQKGHREQALTSSVDLAPTILALAGLEVPESMQGLSLTGLLDNTADRDSWRDAVLMENLFLQEIHSAGVQARKAGGPPDYEAINQDIVANNRSYRSRGIRTGKWKYFLYFEHSPVIEELYDLEHDPHELHNLATSPEHQPTLLTLREKTEALFQQFKH